MNRTLLPRHEVYFLEGAGCDSGRFRRLFRETWRRVPDRSRRRILRHWRRRRPPWRYPWVELLPDWSERLGDDGLRGEKASVSREGYLMRFWIPIVDAYPDDLVMDLIAHELAHVEQHAIGFEGTAIDAEEDADRTMEDWGFSPHGIDEWDVEHGISRVLDWDTMEPAELATHIAGVIERGR